MSAPHAQTARLARVEHQYPKGSRKIGRYPAASISEQAGVKHVFVKAAARVNNRAEKSHQPTRERERRMRGFRSPELSPSCRAEDRSASTSPSNVTVAALRFITSNSTCDLLRGTSTHGSPFSA
jgi:hypothetical protein